MSKNSPLAQVVSQLTQPSNGGRQSRKGGKPKNQSKQKRNRNQNRARGLARNPGTRDSMLSLTRSQFTATSPLNLFTVRSGTSPGGIRVSGRELVAAVTVPVTTGVFTLSTSFPGTSTTASAVSPSVFPRLSAYGPIYEYYIFHKLSYLFQSNQPTTQAGEIIMSVDYDPTDPAPTSTSAMMRDISSTMANIYSDASLQVLKSLSRLPRYETTPAVINEPLQQCQGLLTVAVEGYVAAAITTVGYVIAQYDIEFFTPE